MSELRSNEERWAKLAETATPGPWIVKNEYVIAIEVDGAPAVCQTLDWGDRQLAADAAFVAASREAVPALLAEVTQLRAKLAEAIDSRGTERLIHHLQEQRLREVAGKAPRHRDLRMGTSPHRPSRR